MEREDYMALAIKLAEEAAAAGEVPVGCVIVKGGEVIASARNEREFAHDATGHAELLAIRRACQTLGTWRLSDCTLYVTLEPCVMCTGAIINARVSEVVYGAKDSIAGACGSVLNLFEEGFGHRPRVYGGVRKEECAALLRAFFEEKR